MWYLCRQTTYTEHKAFFVYKIRQTLYMHRANFIYKNRAEHLSKSGLLAYMLTHTSKNPLPQFKGQLLLQTASPHLADYLKGREGNHNFTMMGLCLLRSQASQWLSLLQWLSIHSWPFPSHSVPWPEYLQSPSHQNVLEKNAPALLKKAFELLDVSSRNTFLM